MGKKIVDEDMRLNIKINGNEAKNELFELEEKVRDLRAENDKLEKSIDKYGKQIERNEKPGGEIHEDVGEGEGKRGKAGENVCFGSFQHDGHVCYL